MPKGASLAVVVSCAVFTAGCGSKGAVSLTGAILDPSLAVEQTAIGTLLSGEFDLMLALGKFAPDSATVESPTVSLVEADTNADVGSKTLSVQSPDVTFPLDVAPGKDVTIAFELDASTPIDTDAVDPLCSAPVRIVATVPHSLEGGTTLTARSEPIDVAGCP